MDKRRCCIAKSSLLPGDIIFYQILPRVPSEVLHSWRFVCKQWFHVLSNEPGFLDAQLAMSRPRFIYEIQCRELGIDGRYRKKIDVEITFNNITRAVTSFTREDFVLNKSDWISNKDGDFKAAVDSSSYSTLHSSCNGLILVFKSHKVKGPMYYIVNPATRQWVTLPPCAHAIQVGKGLGYDPATKKYKVVRIFIEYILPPYRSGTFVVSHGCAVLTVGSNKWKAIRYPFKNGEYLDRSLYVNGFLHFKCGPGPRPQSPGCYTDTIVSMDIAHETFRLTSPPEGICSEVSIFKLGDSLALSPHPHGGNLGIWVLEDCSKGIWTKKYSLTMNSHHGCPRRGTHGGLPDTLRPIGAFNSGEGEVVIYTEEYKEEEGFRLFYYVTWSEELKEVTSPWKNIQWGDGQYDIIIQAINYVGTLVSPHDLVNKTA